MNGVNVLSECEERTLRKMGTFDVSLELLAELLRLPESDRIAHVEYKFQPPLITIIVQGDENSELPYVNDGVTAQRVNPTYNRDNETGKVTFVKY